MGKVMVQDFISKIDERKTIYQFLKVGFEAPLTMETLNLWKEHFTPDFIEIISVNNDELHLFFQELKDNDLNVVTHEQKEAYKATFDVFNEAGRIPAPPWESVYVTKDSTMFGEPVFQIRRQLENFGLQFVNYNQEPEDHIAIELEFMRYLIEFTEEAARLGNMQQYEKGIYTQYWLHKEHFYHWINPFTKDILSSDTSHFYKGLAKLLKFFVEEDFEYIKSLKEALENE